jgi:hypothetical protein
MKRLIPKVKTGVKIFCERIEKAFTAFVLPRSSTQSFASHSEKYDSESLPRGKRLSNAKKIDRKAKKEEKI